MAGPRCRIRPVLPARNPDRASVMTTYDKQCPPAQAVKFEIDSHGVLVPTLRHGKASFLRPDLQIKQLRMRLKTSSRR